ncbi:trypsin-like peptidase domain-containing protein [Serratia marcescens]|nr:serine protease [Serratia marcescens]MBS3894616.1 trypsin-like peptidase domain-containing protein [Serratia marcescens]
MELASRIRSNTCRIVCQSPEGEVKGTCFWFGFVKPGEPGMMKPILVTNKHVVDGCTEARLIVNVFIDGSSTPVPYELHIPNVDVQFLKHPDPNVDLAVLDASWFFSHFAEKNIEMDVFIFTNEVIESGERISSIEDVYMTGYPNGLWDEVNNKPITRKGITATSVSDNWNGKREFVIDMACFAGSSGSPVYILNQRFFSINNGVDTRLLFLGVLYGGPVAQVNGSVDVVSIPTSTALVSRTQQGLNLGFVVKAECLNDFKPLLGIA